MGAGNVSRHIQLVLLLMDPAWFKSIKTTVAESVGAHMTNILYMRKKKKSSHFLLLMPFFAASHHRYFLSMDAVSHVFYIYIYMHTDCLCFKWVTHVAALRKKSMTDTFRVSVKFIDNGYTWPAVHDRLSPGQQLWSDQELTHLQFVVSHIVNTTLPLWVKKPKPFRT